MADVAYRFGTTVDFKKHRLLNLLTSQANESPTYIEDLGVWLKTLNSKVLSGGVYAFVDDPARLNVVLGSYPAGNTEIVPSELKDTQTGLEYDYQKPTKNNFGQGFTNNTFTHPFNSNSFSFGTDSNTFGKGFSANKVGSNFNRNTIGNSCHHNVFGEKFVNNKLTGNNFSNQFGDSCFGLILGSNVNNCIIGNGCEGVTFGANCKRVTLIDCVNDADTPLVIPDNTSDVTYKNNVLTLDPYGVAGKLGKTANLSDLQDKAASRLNLGLTDATDKILSTLLPGFVDEVNDDYGTLTALQAAIPTGSKGVIYITTDNDKQYRWSGTAYHVMVQTPGTTDAVAEGVNNLYFTPVRSIGALLTGYAKAAASRVIAAGDSVLTAIGILEKKADDNAAAITALAQSRKATIVQAFVTQAVVTVVHGYGRFAGVQVYEADGIQTDGQVRQVDLNTVEISFADPLSGSVIVF
jgi:hypothetical protein